MGIYMLTAVGTHIYEIIISEIVTVMIRPFGLTEYD